MTSPQTAESEYGARETPVEINDSDRRDYPSFSMPSYIDEASNEWTMMWSIEYHYEKDLACRQRLGTSQVLGVTFELLAAQGRRKLRAAELNFPFQTFSWSWRLSSRERNNTIHHYRVLTKDWILVALRIGTYKSSLLSTHRREAFYCTRISLGIFELVPVCCFARNFHQFLLG